MSSKAGKVLNRVSQVTRLTYRKRPKGIKEITRSSRDRTGVSTRYERGRPGRPGEGADEGGERVNDGETMRLIVAERQVPRIAREAQTPDDAVRIVREAVENNPTLKAMSENRVTDEEALELTARVTREARPAMLRALSRRGPKGQDAAFMHELIEDLRRKGEI